MRTVVLFAIAGLVTLPLAHATHDTGCIITSADPNTYLVIDSVIDLDGDNASEIYYQEERDTGLPPVPMTGFLLSNGSWTWEENNGIPGLQRGGWSFLEEMICETQLVICFDDGRDLDEVCGHGYDVIVL